MNREALYEHFEVKYLRAPEAQRSPHLLLVGDEFPVAQISGRLLTQKSTGTTWLHTRVWLADRSDGQPHSYRARYGHWHHTLTDVATGNVSCTVTARTDKEGWKRVAHAMVERGVWEDWK